MSSLETSCLKRSLKVFYLSPLAKAKLIWQYLMPIMDHVVHIKHATR